MRQVLACLSMSENKNQPFKKDELKVQSSLGIDDIFSSQSDPQVITVEQLNIQIKQKLEGEFGIIWLKGEISNFKAHTSGHFYFSLKDSRSQITAVMFRGHNMRLKFKPKDGLEVIARARISVYEPRGNYQLLVEHMEPVGAGALQKAFDDLKLKLRNEGLFDPAKKKKIPAMPRNIAIVTSPTGAAIRDILNILQRRAPSIQVTIIPSIVQGAEAAPQLREAFKKATSLKNIDAVIIGRGGGSIEDMWCFNDEELARLIASSPVPVISAVGHEIDFTICDFVADLRAPTPSAAAELVAKSTQELLSKVQSLDRLMLSAWERYFRRYRDRVISLSKQLIDPKRKLQDLSLRNDDLLNRLEFAVRTLIDKRSHRVELGRRRLGNPLQVVQQKKNQVSNSSEKLNRLIGFVLERKLFRLQKQMSVLDSLSPLKVVDRGYSIVRSGESVVKDASQVKLDQELNIKLARGEVVATVKEIKET